MNVKFVTIIQSVFGNPTLSLKKKFEIEKSLSDYFSQT